MRTGRLITIEGQDGSGKSTLARALSGRLAETGIPTLLTREPGGSDIGASIRAVLLDGNQLDVWTEAFLFLAERRRHCTTVIQPALEAGTWVVCDRFADSTLAYQGHAGGADLETLRTLNSIATQGLTPDLTLLLDLDPQSALKRLNNPNRIDRMPIEYHERVRQGFLSEAQREPHRWRVLDATRSPEAVLQEALRLTADALGLEAILAPGGDQL
jgi:dTMP kinase